MKRYKNLDPLGVKGYWELYERVSEKKGKVRVRGEVNLAISRKRSVEEQNGIKIWTLWVKRGIGESYGRVSEKKGKVRVRGKVNMAISRKRSK